MGEHPGELDLPLESADGLLVLGGALRRQDLDRDGRPGPLVSREVDLAHPPLPEPVQNPVIAEEEAPGPSVEQLVGLVSRQQADFDESSGEPLGVVVQERAVVIEDLADLLGVHESAALEVVEEDVEAGHVVAIPERRV